MPEDWPYGTNSVDLLNLNPLMSSNNSFGMEMSPEDLMNIESKDFSTAFPQPTDNVGAFPIPEEEHMSSELSSVCTQFVISLQQHTNSP